MQINARKGTPINPETGQNVELDIYIPSLNLGFEFQVIFPNPPHHPSNLNSLLSLLLLYSSRKSIIIRLQAIPTTLLAITSNAMPPKWP